MKDNTTEGKFEYLNVDGIKYKTRLTKKYLNRKPFHEVERNKVNAFISGIVRDIHVKKGTQVNEGEPLLVLEAMKMRNIINSPVDGTIKKIFVKTDDAVVKNQLLIEIK